MEITRDALRQVLPVRVGDLERDACVVSLIGHHLQGRLPTEELERRQRLASVAVTSEDIRLLLMDLPDFESSAVAPTGDRRAATPGSVRVPEAVRDLLPLGKALLPVVPLIGVASVGQAVWQYSDEGHFFTAAFAGAVGYATHAVTMRFRR